MSWAKLSLSKKIGGIGFRDLEIFNLAMLAKQGWRLIQNLDSLAARILKDKYFREGDFLYAQLGRRPSYAWQSILKARCVLEEGLVWRVGNRDHIRIWGDKWTFSTSSHRIHSPVKDLGPDARVSPLIDQGSGWWNFTLIHPIFEPAEADAICAMSLSPLRGPDKLVLEWFKIWVFIFSQECLSFRTTAEGYDDGGKLSYHGEPGAVEDPMGIEIFRGDQELCMEVCQNLLSTKTKLFHKNIVHDPFFPLCFYEVETSSHILRHCPSSLAVWQKCSHRAQKLSLTGLDVHDVINLLLNKLDEGEIQEAFTVANCLWLRRNTHVLRRDFTLPHQVLTTAKGMLESFFFG